MIPKPPSCEGCPLYDYSKTGFVPAKWPETTFNGVLVVAEAPGEFEELKGLPLVGVSGQKFDSLLSRGRMQRGQFGLHNVLSCRPPGNSLRGAPYEFLAINHCRPNLNETIAKLKPKVIVAMGNVALRALTGYEGILRYRGFVLDGPKDAQGATIPVVPSLHPSFLLPRKGEASSARFTPAVIRDLQLAEEIARNGFQRLQTDYLEDPSLEQSDRYATAYEAALRQDAVLGLGCDIETNYKLKAKDESKYKLIDPIIVRISFCFKAGYAISVAWTAENMPFIRRMLSSSGRKYWWYGYTFDLPIIRAAKIDVCGEQLDMLWAWHMLMPDLDRGLEPATSFFAPDILPWKHESLARPAFYSCVDADALWRNAQGIEEQLRRNNQWELYLRQVVRLDPYLQIAGQTGIFIDKAARRRLYKKLRREQKRLIALIQPLVPPEILPLKRYKTKRGTTVWEGRREIRPVSVSVEKVKRCAKCGAMNIKASEHTSRKGGKKGIPLNECYKAEVLQVPGTETHFDVVMDFNPNSDLQLAKLIEKLGHLKHVKAWTPTGRPSLDDYELARLDDKFPNFPQKFLIYKDEDHEVYGGLYALIQELNEVQTSISRYVVGLRPDANGVVKTEITYVPATGRLSSRGLQQGTDKGTNLQNIPHKEDFRYADDIREMIVPRPGYVFVEADSCVEPNALVLKADLTWVRAADIKKGDELIGVDEATGGRFIKTKVEHTRTLQRPKVAVNTTQGKTIVAANHPFFARRFKYGRKWTLAKDLKPGMLMSFLAHPWEVERSVEAGYLQGFFDGEGYLTRTKVGFGQNPTPTLAYVKTLLANRRFPFAYGKTQRADSLKDRRGVIKGKVVQGRLENMADAMRFIGSIRPPRLLKKAETLWAGRRTWGKRTRIATVLDVQKAATGDVIAIQTSTKTYISDGFFSHNSSIEAVGTGHFMQDPEYTKIAMKGIHSFLCCKELGLEFTDENIKLVKKEHRVLYDRKKKSTYGVLYGMGPDYMHKLWPKAFPNRFAAQKEIDTMYRMLPNLAAWHHALRVQANKDGYIVTPWGYRRYFYDVFTYVRDKEGNVLLNDQGRPKIKLGEDGNAVVAQKPQNFAAAFMRDNARVIGKVALQKGWLLPANYLVHDSYCLETPNDPEQIQLASYLLATVLTRPIPEMNNIRVGCEIKVGLNWGPGMKTTKVVRV
ncbi:MAG: uracil-DNA glycosylase family protein [Terriglobia bacterium]